MDSIKVFGSVPQDIESRHCFFDNGSVIIERVYCVNTQYVLCVTTYNGSTLEKRYIIFADKESMNTCIEVLSMLD